MHVYLVYRTDRVHVHVYYFVQLVVLCPGALYLLQRHAFFSGGSPSDDAADIGIALVEANVEGTIEVPSATGVWVVNGVNGFGHTRSLASSGQYLAMILYRYHCRSSERPAVTTRCGRHVATGRQSLSLRMEEVSSSLSEATLKQAGAVTWNVKCWYCLMFFSLRTCPAIIAVQSYVGTTTSLFWVPTN